MLSDKKVQNLYREFQANQQIFRVLESSKALTENIFDELSVILIMLDEDGKILKLNKSGQEVYKTTEPKVLGTNIKDLLDKNAVGQLDEYLSDADVNRNRHSFEDQVVIDGQEKFLFWQVCSVFQPDGRENKTVHVLIGNDTTDARIAHERNIEFKKDLEVAKAVQTLLLPKQETSAGSFYDVSGFYHPAAQVGGDFWWYSDLPNGDFLCVIADVMGHGAGSAMVTAMLASALDAYVSTMTKDTCGEDDLSKMWDRINNLIGNLCNNEFFVAMSAAVIKPDSEELLLYGMGFPPSLILRPDQKGKSIFNPGNPVGLDNENFKPGIKRLELKKGERLVMVTDGCYEPLAKRTNEVGFRKLFKMFEETKQQENSASMKNVALKLMDALGNDIVDDDVTFVVLDRK